MKTPDKIEKDWEPWHYWRECHNCGFAGGGYLHCLHDSMQNECHGCGERMPSLPDGDCKCEFVLVDSEVAQAHEQSRLAGLDEAIEAGAAVLPCGMCEDMFENALERLKVAHKDTKEELKGLNL